MTYIGIDIYRNITNFNLSDDYGHEIEHYTCNYVDDSLNVISSSNISKLQNYINDFFKLLENYYNINKLTINCEKSKLLVSCKGKYRNEANKIILRAADYIINQTSKIKVLGIYITNNLSNQATINNVISKVNYRLAVVRDVYKYSSVRTKTLLATSMIMSVVRYVCPLL